MLFRSLAPYYHGPAASQRRSIPYKALDERFMIKKERSGSILNYLETLNVYVKYKSEMEVYHESMDHQ